MRFVPTIASLLRSQLNLVPQISLRAFTKAKEGCALLKEAESNSQNVVHTLQVSCCIR